MRALFYTFARVGLLSFGGPAAQIALMHRELVEEKKWLTEADFLRALSFCMMLPGPEAMQLATYAGWKLRGVPGGLLSGALFVTPGALLIALLAFLYVSYGTLPLVNAAFVGVKATVVVIVVQAITRLTGKAIKSTFHGAMAIGAFIALFVFAIPFPVAVVTAAIAGLLRQVNNPALPSKAPPFNKALRPAVIGGIIWVIPILLALALNQEFLVAIGLFFSKLALVSFGGAYAVLTYMTQEVVSSRGWLTAPEMLDALGLAETTPGPLILVTEFVAIIAGIKTGGWLLGVFAGIMVLWVTFVPCFIWIFTGAPFIGWLETKPRLSSALASVTAAVVGVIANLSLWFALHVYFSDLLMIEIGAAQLLLPVMTSIRPEVVILSAIAAALIFWRKWGLITALTTTSGISALGSFVMSLMV